MILLGCPATSPSRTSCSRLVSEAIRARISARSVSSWALASERLSADRTDASRTSSSNGFSRKSTRAELHRLDRERHVAVPGNDDDGKPNLHLLEPPQQIDSADPRHPHVGDDASGTDRRRHREEGRSGLVGLHGELRTAKQKFDRIRARPHRRRSREHLHQWSSRSSSWLTARTVNRKMVPPWGLGSTVIRPP